MTRRAPAQEHRRANMADPVWACRTQPRAWRGCDQSQHNTLIYNVTATDAAEIEARVKRSLEEEVRNAFAGVFADTGIRIA